MKFLTYLLLATVSFAGQSFAADRSTDKSSSQHAVLRIICNQNLVNETGSAYQPNVDVNGNAVASADLNPSLATSHSTYTELPLTVDLANRLGLSRPAEAQAVVGSLRVYKDGRVLFNGQDITQQATANCGDVKRSADVPANLPPAEINRPHSPSGTTYLQAPATEPSRNVYTVSQPEVPMPASAAPSSTTLK